MLYFYIISLYIILIINPIICKSQCIKGDCSNGYSILKYQNGTYEGEFKNNKPNGKGKLLFDNGDYNDGEFENDFFEGKGIKYTAEDSTLIEGYWVKDKLKDGKVLIKKGNKILYDGDMKENKYHGYGTLYFSSGGKYEGEFKNNLFYGKGKYVNSEGDKFEGYFEDGKEEGFGKVNFNNGNRFEGYFHNGLQNGKGILYTTNEGELRGNWKDGKFISGPSRDTTGPEEGIAQVKMEKTESGVYKIPIKINNIGPFNFILDTGAGELFLTPDIVLMLVREDKIQLTDLLEGGYFIDAQGNINYNARFNIQEIDIGGFKFKNIAAAVAKNEYAENLLGQNVLMKLSKFMVNYENDTFTIFK